jgi:hypothetical protein
MSSPDAGERLARVSRMRTLSALLDDDLDDDQQLPEECRALFAHVAAAAAKDAKDSGDEDAAQLEQTRRNEFMCVECQAHEAELFCEQCHDYFCELCYGGQHRKGNRRKHTFQPRFPASKTVPVAAEQQEQVADVDMGTAKDAVDYDVRRYCAL